VLRVVTVYAGNVSASLVRVGELFREAVRDNVTSVVLVHNHPSGDPTPSPEDLHLTAEALAAGACSISTSLTMSWSLRAATQASATAGSRSTDELKQVGAAVGS
jgi:hypothetical protein